MTEGGLDLDNFEGFGHINKLTAARTFRKLLGDNVLFLRNEDMDPNVIDTPGGFLDRLANFTGLSREGFPSEVSHGKTNCGGSKHDATAICEPEKGGSAYPIAGGRKMLPATRRLIYIQYANNCKAWKEEFGIEYPECILQYAGI